MSHPSRGSPRTPKAWTRRDALRFGGIALLGAAAPARLLRAADALRFSKDPFTLGVAIRS